MKYSQVMVPFTDSARWALPASPELIKATNAFFQEPDSYPIDARGTAYSFAFSAQSISARASST